MLVILAIKYVQGHSLESMGLEFYLGNAGVNTSALELLECLLDHMDDPGVCGQLVGYVMEPLGRVLGHAVVNQEYIVQIQVLSLFKAVFFNSSFRKKAGSEQVRGFFNRVFTGSVFLDTMLQGLRTPFSYVRSQFISFITSCI